MRAKPERARYGAVGFDLLTALLDTLPLWRACAADDGLGERWHARSQERLRGKPYHAFEDNVRAAAADVGVAASGAEALLARWGEFAPWPDSLATLDAIAVERRFIVTNCSQRLADRAAARLGDFALVMTAERAGAYKPDPRPYRAALDALRLDGSHVLFVAGSAHDVGGAGALGMDVYWANRLRADAPTDGRALREARDLSGLAELLA